MSNFRYKYRIREIFQELVGETAQLITDFSEYSGMAKDKVYRYYNNKQLNLTHEDATLFLDFFNKHKHPKRSNYVIADLYVSLTSKIKLLKWRN